MVAGRLNAAGRWAKRRPLLAAALLPVAALASFALAGWIGSSLPRNGAWREPAAGTEILIYDNGVHTAIVMPLVTQARDWNAVFPASEVAQPARPYTHIAISYGERRVFLDTRTWADLRPATVLRVLAGRGEGMLHVERFVRPAPSDEIRPFRITEAQYRRLMAEIDRFVPPPPRKSHPGYGGNDVFHETRHGYSAGYTCNQWTSDTIAAAGVRTGRFTPFAGGVMKWVPRPPARLPN